jgi:hypothetical protein
MKFLRDFRRKIHTVFDFEERIGVLHELVLDALQTLLLPEVFPN